MGFGATTEERTRFQSFAEDHRCAGKLLLQGEVSKKTNSKRKRRLWKSRNEKYTNCHVCRQADEPKPQVQALCVVNVLYETVC